LAFPASPDMLNLIATMIATGAATMVFALALFYMAGQLFKKPEYEAFVSIEIYQIIISLVIFSTIFTASWGVNEIAKSLNNGQDMFSTASSYLRYITDDIALEAVQRLQALAILTQWASSITMRFGASVWGVTIPAFPALTVIERSVDFLLILLSPFTASLIVQQIGLQVIAGIMLPFVLPMGAVLRFFPPTRDAGSFLMATALGFGLIFPFTYVMHSKIVGNASTPNTLIYRAFESQTANDVNQFLVDKAPKVVGYINEGGLFNANMLFSPFLKISFLLLQSVFLPALSITLTIAFIKGFNKFIGKLG